MMQTVSVDVEDNGGAVGGGVVEQNASSERKNKNCTRKGENDGSHRRIVGVLFLISWISRNGKNYRKPQRSALSKCILKILEIDIFPQFQIIIPTCFFSLCLSGKLSILIKHCPAEPSADGRMKSPSNIWPLKMSVSRTDRLLVC